MAPSRVQIIAMKLAQEYASRIEKGESEGSTTEPISLLLYEIAELMDRVNHLERNKR